MSEARESVGRLAEKFNNKVIQKGARAWKVVSNSRGPGIKQAEFRLGSAFVFSRRSTARALHPYNFYFSSP